MNNFDTSTTGVNIEFNAFYDTIESQWHFDENFKRSELANDTFYYIDCGNVEAIDVTDTSNFKFTKADIYELIDGEELDVEYYLEGVNPKRATKAELIEAIEYCLQPVDCARAYQKYFENIAFEVFTTRGYCQGDYAQVIVPKSLVGEWTQECIDKKFWDTRIYFEAKIDSSEFNFYEYLNDEYTWCKDEALAAIKKFVSDMPAAKQKIVIDYFEENLPSELDYR